MAKNAKIKVNDIVYWHDPAIHDFKPADRKKLAKQQYIVESISEEEAWIYDIDDPMHEVQVLPEELELVYPVMYAVSGYTYDGIRDLDSAPVVHLNRDAAIIDLVDRYIKFMKRTGVVKKGKLVTDPEAHPTIYESTLENLLKKDEDKLKLYQDGKLSTKKAKDILIDAGVTSLMLSGEAEDYCPMWCDFSIDEVRPKD